MKRRIRALGGVGVAMLVLASLAPAHAANDGTIQGEIAFQCDIILDEFPVEEKVLNSGNCVGTAAGQGTYEVNGQVDEIIGVGAFIAYNIEYFEPGGIQSGEANGHVIVQLTIVSVVDPGGEKETIFDGTLHTTFDWVREGLTAAATFPSTKREDMRTHIHDSPVGKGHKHDGKGTAKVSCPDGAPADGAGVAAFVPEFVPPNPVTGEEPVEDGLVHIAGTAVIACA